MYEFSCYYSSTSTTPRNAKQVSFERGNLVLEHQGEFFFQFSSFDFENKNVFFHFFIIIKIVNLDIIQKSKKILLGVADQTFTAAKNVR